MGNLERHAEFELKRAGMFDEDSDYGWMLGHSTMKLIKVFAEEGHSGMSASIQISLFKLLASFKTLTPITNNPDEWNNISDMSPNPTFQNRRDSACFSNDGGKTYHSVDDTVKTTYTAIDDEKKKP